MSDPFVDAVAAMKAEFPGFHVRSVDASMSYGSRDEQGQYKPDVGSYHRFYGDSWGVTVQQQGWDHESETFIEWAATPTEALAAIVTHMRERRDNPHLAHIEDKVLLAECPDCVADCDRLGIDPAELQTERELVVG